ncbi:uncharacterized protein LOC143493451 [Brachyhypopomus gauderio]|uniref:uncharacterized protein LOC143493451 n=1 Tax=Brachyhypopomus gauderio TaxID=698409 RepID=UPI00404303FF
MQFRFEVQMLVVLVVVLVAPSVSEGRVLSKCELRDLLNTTLHVNVLDFNITKIVCIAELNSGLNTSEIRNITVPSDDDDDDASPERGPAKRHRRGNSDYSSEEAEHDFDSSTVKAPTTPQRNGSFTGVTTAAPAQKSHDGPRRPRSAYGFKMHVSGGGHHGSKSGHSSSSEESDETETWTLYGLFQLPDRIACSSGRPHSLNLCNITCDSLTDDDLSDDIACVGTILTKAFSTGKHRDSFKELFQKLGSVWQQNKCDNVVDVQYFSSC